MRVRKLIREKKTLESDTNWRSPNMKRKHAPVHAKTVPIRAGWQWRSAKVFGVSGRYVLFAKCNRHRDNWQAVLTKVNLDSTASAVTRHEHHGGHPGLHVHAHCKRSGVELGTQSLDDLIRVPATRSRSRTRQTGS